LGSPHIGECVLVKFIHSELKCQYRMALRLDEEPANPLNLRTLEKIKGTEI